MAARSKLIKKAAAELPKKRPGFIEPFGLEDSDQIDSLYFAFRQLNPNASIKELAEFMYDAGRYDAIKKLDWEDEVSSWDHADSRKTVSDEQVDLALEECSGNVTQAAKRLGISRTQLNRRLKS